MSEWLHQEMEQFDELCADAVECLVADEIKELNGYMLDGLNVVRCKDCVYMSDDGLTTAWCNENCREVGSKDFCVWGYKK